jgi:hypothetical protein
MFRSLYPEDYILICHILYGTYGIVLRSSVRLVDWYRVCWPIALLVGHIRNNYIRSPFLALNKFYSVVLSLAACQFLRCL